jgi:predicted ATPase
MQTVEFDPVLTLIAGRNDVGKSALLRAMRVIAEHGAPRGPGQISQRPSFGDSHAKPY